MPLPGNLNIEMYQGNSFTRDFLIENDVEGELVPVDFSDHVLSGFIRTHPTSGRVLAVLGFDFPNDGEDSQGEFTAFLTPTQTLRLPPKCVYDIQSVNENTGEVRTWVYGAIKVIRQVTRG
jgi:hypothetical protein